MGKQINFGMGIETEKNFFEFIKQQGKVLYRGDNPKYEVIEEFPPKKSQLLLCKSLEGINIEILSNGIEHICEIDNPVIKFTQTSVNEEKKIIARGRIWLEMSVWNEKNELVKKDEELNKWYQSLRRWVIKNTSYEEVSFGEKFYVDKEILELVKGGYTFY